MIAISKEEHRIIHGLPAQKEVSIASAIYLAGENIYMPSNGFLIDHKRDELNKERIRLAANNYGVTEEEIIETIRKIVANGVVVVEEVLGALENVFNSFRSFKKMASVNYMNCEVCLYNNTKYCICPCMDNAVLKGRRWRNKLKANYLMGFSYM